MVAEPAGGVAVELDSRLPGRGAHCCFSPSCVGAALKPKNLGRALKRAARPPEASQIVGRLRALLLERIAGFIAAGQRKGVLSAGREAAARAARAGRGGRMLLAGDLAEGSRREVAQGAEVELPLGMEELGRLLGRSPVGVLFLADASLADAVALRVDQLRALGQT